MGDLNGFRPTVWVVTGSNRGMGYAYVSEALSRHNTSVVAAARPVDDTSELVKLREKFPTRLMIVELELTSPAMIQAAAVKVQQAHPQGIDYLINNAGVLGSYSSIADQTLEELQQTLLTNVVGTFSVTKAFLPLLKAGQQKTIVHISSIASSLSNNASFVRSGSHSDAGMALSYRISKVSLNMETTVLANDLKTEGFRVISIHPGEVDTVMWKYLADNVFTDASKGNIEGWRRPHLTPQQSVQAMVQVITRLTPKDSGKFFLYDGSEVPW